MLRKLIAVAIFCAAPVAFAHGPAPESAPAGPLKIEKVAGNVYVIQGSGGNISASIGPDGILLVDAGMGAVGPQILEALRTVSDKPVRYVVNTHVHPDHTGADAFFAPTAAIIATKATAARMATGLTVMGTTYPALGAASLPNLTFDGVLSLTFNGEQIDVARFPPSHTDGDALVFFTKSGVVHLGDNYFAGKLPFVDLDNGGNVLGLISNIEWIIKYYPGEMKVIPGHGPVGTVADLNAYDKLIVDSLTIVKNQRQRGVTADEMKQQKILKDFEQYTWSMVSTDNWIDAVCRQFAKDPVRARRPGSPAGSPVGGAAPPAGGSQPPIPVPVTPQPPK